MGRLIPAGTGLEHYRSIQLLTEMPAPAPIEEIPEAAELTAEEAAALDSCRKTAKPTLQQKASRPQSGFPLITRINSQSVPVHTGRFVFSQTVTCTVQAFTRRASLPRCGAIPK